MSESFEKWWDSPEHSFAVDCPSDIWIAKAAYTAGLLRAAEVVEYNAGEYATEVAGMIRKEAGE